MAASFGYLKEDIQSDFLHFEDVPVPQGRMVAATTGTPWKKPSNIYDLSVFCTPSNQYDLSSCVGNAVADAVEILDAVQGKPVVQLSRLFVYAMARILHQKLHEDKGTYISTAFEVLSRFGICSEEVWPYDTSKVFVVPSLKAERDARAHKISAYYKITSKGKDRIPQILRALENKCPVVFGTLVATDLGSHVGEDVVRIPSSSNIGGGHAMVVVGYSPEKRAFLVKNSWGTGFGKDGFAFFDEEYLCWDETWDMWVPFGGYTDG